MVEPQLRRVQRQARRAAWIGRFLTFRPWAVYLFATNRMAQFGKVDANLVRSARFELAPEHGVALQALGHVDMGDGFLAFLAAPAAAAAAITAITDQGRANRLCFHLARHDGQIAALDRMRLELPSQAALGVHGAGEDDEAAGLLVQALHDA